MTIKESHQQAIQMGVHPGTLSNLPDGVTVVNSKTGITYQQCDVPPEGFPDDALIVIGSKDSVVDVMTLKQFNVMTQDEWSALPSRARHSHNHQKAIQMGVDPVELNDITNQVKFIDPETGRLFSYTGIPDSGFPDDTLVLIGDENDIVEVTTYKQFFNDLPKE